MNVINTTVTSAFLSELTKDKSLIKTINPKVIFRRILGVGENVDRSDVIRALQNHAKSCGKLDKFRNDLIDKALVGEVISFDIGPSPSWVKFSVMREPLPKPKTGATINFIVAVTDRQNCKRYTRLIGAIANESDENGNRSPVFRTISDMCETDDIPPEVNPAKLKALKDLDEIIVHNKCMVYFVKTGDDTAKIVAYENPEEILFPKVYTDGSKDLDGEEGVCFLYQANNDVRRALLEQCSISDILVEFDKVDTRELVIVAKDDEVKIEGGTDSTGSYINVKPINGEDRILIGASVANIDGLVNGVFRAKQNITGKFIDEHPLTGLNVLDETGWLSIGFSLVEAETAGGDGSEPTGEEQPTADENTGAEPAVESAVDASEIANAQIDQPAEAIADIDNKPTVEVPESKVIFTAGEEVDFEDDPDGIFIAKQDITTEMWDSKATAAERMSAFFDRKPKNTETQPIETQKEETKMNELFAKKDDVIEVGGVKCRAKEDITVEYVKEHNGDVSAMTEPVEDQPAAVEPADEVKPIGEVPDSKDIRDSISAALHCQVLFGTTSPSIMHVMELLKAECQNSEIYKLTGTFPPEQITVMPVEIEPGKVETFTYAILRMKNGAYYRIWVSFTDKDALANPALAGDYSWTRTREDKARWMKVIDIQDREISNINNRRRV